MWSYLETAPSANGPWYGGPGQNGQCAASWPLLNSCSVPFDASAGPYFRTYARITSSYDTADDLATATGPAVLIT